MAHKLSVTIDGNKIEYEGDAVGVAERFDRLTELLVHVRPMGHADPKEPPAPVAEAALATSQEEAATEERAPDSEEPFSDLDRDPAYSHRDLSRLFSLDGGTVYLSGKIPAEPYFRALLVFYGAWATTGKRFITAPAAGKALRKSGDESVRLDRLLAEYGEFYECRGKYRGKKYALTDLGVNACEAIIESVIGRE